MPQSFHSLGLSQPLVAQLESLGFVAPTPVQEEAIPALLSGRDLVAQARTGTGKTAAFSLPILESIPQQCRNPRALILTPTRELAQQVCTAVTRFCGREDNVAAVYGGQSIVRQLRQLRQGVGIVVGTPGRVRDLLQRGDLRLEELSWLVLDEADEMLGMGFLEDIEAILEASPEDRQTAFFSATMPRPIRRLADRFLKDPASIALQDEPQGQGNIRQEAFRVPRGWTKAQALQQILAYEDPSSAILFVRTRRGAAELTAQLQGAGHRVDEYHGDLGQSQRERLLERFRDGRLRWIVATDIAARGIHVDDLTHVINVDLPDSPENYVHRIGRTGRAGREGQAISLIAGYEIGRLRGIERLIGQRMDLQDLPSRDAVEARSRDGLRKEVERALEKELHGDVTTIVQELSREHGPEAIAAAALALLHERIKPSLPDLPPPSSYDRGDRGERREPRRSGGYGDRRRSAGRSNDYRPSRPVLRGRH